MRAYVCLVQPTQNSYAIGFDLHSLIQGRGLNKQDSEKMV